MKLRSFLTTVFAVILLAAAIPAPVETQSADQTAKPALPPPPAVTLKVTVSISRWEGEKRVANAPFVLTVVPSDGQRARVGSDGEYTTIQMGSDYPLPVPVLSEARNNQPATTVSYRAIGTNVSAAARPVDDGRFDVMVSVQDTQVDKPQAGMTNPRFQTFKSTNRLVMRDGQTTQYTVATDTVTGQVVKLDVTMNIMK